MKSLRVVAVVAVCATAVLWGSSSAEAGGGGPSITLAISPTMGPAGTEITASGACFADSQTFCFGVLVTLLDPDGAPVDSDASIDEGGEYDLSVTVPADGPCGDYTVLAEGGDSEEILVDTSEVFAVPCEEPTTEPPTESSSTTEAVAVAAATRPSFTG